MWAAATALAHSPLVIGLGLILAGAWVMARTLNRPAPPQEQALTAAGWCDPIEPEDGAPLLIVSYPKRPLGATPPAAGWYWDEERHGWTKMV